MLFKIKKNPGHVPENQDSRQHCTCTCCLSVGPAGWGSVAWNIWPGWSARRCWAAEGETWGPGGRWRAGGWCWRARGAGAACATAGAGSALWQAPATRAVQYTFCLIIYIKINLENNYNQ